VSQSPALPGQTMVVVVNSSSAAVPSPGVCGMPAASPYHTETGADLSPDARKHDHKRGPPASALAACAGPIKHRDWERCDRSIGRAGSKGVLLHNASRAQTDTDNRYMILQPSRESQEGESERPAPSYHSG